MGFITAKAMPVTIFKLADTTEFTAETVNAIRQFAMVNTPAPDPEQQVVYGLTGMGDELDTGFDKAVDFGDNLRFSLRVDSRRIPASTFKRELNKTLHEELRAIQQRGGTFIPRIRKQEIKHMLKTRLLQQMPWTTAMTDVVVMPQTKRMYVFSKNKFVLDTMSDIATNVFSCVPEELCMSTDGCAALLRAIYDHSLTLGDFEIAYSGKGAKLVKSTENGKESVSVVHADPAMTAGIQDDMDITKMSLYCRSTDGDELKDIYMDVDGCMTITKLNLPKVDHIEGDEDYNAEFTVRIGWVERAEQIIQSLCDMEEAE